MTSVLLADDQQDLREALTELVKSEPTLRLVGVAADADEAIALARSHRPDVALLDYKMPGGGGPRAAKEIGHASPRTRVIALSAYEDRGAVLEMVRAGAVAYVVKGASGQEIRATIDRTMRGESTLSPEVAGNVVVELGSRLRAQSAAEEAGRARRERVLAALRDGRTAVHLQPILDLRTLVPIGYEALARFFAEPTQAPNVWFLDAAAAGLQEELELAAVRAALPEVARLPGGVFLSVNVSPAVLLSPRLLELLERAPAGLVVLEMTEHAEIEEYEAVERVLSGFRKQGGRLAVDDAGAGFSSLRHILRLAPDFIKLDASLTRQIDLDASRRALAKSLISFATDIGSVIIAEGVETAGELATLSDLGVRYGQGFHLARPAPAELALLAAAGRR